MASNCGITAKSANLERAALDPNRSNCGDHRCRCCDFGTPGVLPSSPSTAAAAQDLYFNIHKNLAINDPLSDNSKGLQWDENSNCFFRNRGYHAIIPKNPGSRGCMARNSNSKNFMFEVQMTVTEGGYGGISFRSDNDGSNGYRFRLGSDRVYSVAIYHDGKNTEVKQGLSPNFNQESPSTLTVIAQEDRLYFYINTQYVYDIKDSSYGKGIVGLIAGSVFGTGEVVYTDAHLWEL